MGASRWGEGQGKGKITRAKQPCRGKDRRMGGEDPPKSAGCVWSRCIGRQAIKHGRWKGREEYAVVDEMVG